MNIPKISLQQGRLSVARWVMGLVVGGGECMCQNCGQVLGSMCEDSG